MVEMWQVKGSKCVARFEKLFPKHAVSIASRRELQLCYELNQFATKNFVRYILFLPGSFGSQV